MAKKNEFRIPKPQSDSYHVDKRTLLSGEALVDKIQKRPRLEFSFVLFDRKHKAFNLGSNPSEPRTLCGNWFLDVLDTFSELSQHSIDYLLSGDGARTYQPHPIIDGRTNYDVVDEFMSDFKRVLGAEFENQYDPSNFLQIRVCGGKGKGRIHFYLIENHAYILWLDPYHNMYDSEGYGGQKYYKSPRSCYEELLDNNIKLNKENKELQILLDELTKPL